MVFVNYMTVAMNAFGLILLVSLTYLANAYPTTTTVPTTTASGCYYNGKQYSPGDSFGSGYDPSSNWCYGAYCDASGHIIHWDNFHCHTTTPLPTTTPPMTTTPMGCYYNNQWYAPGTLIDEGYDPSSNWCYFTRCDDYGNILNGDDFNCVKTTLPTTTPEMTTTPPRVAVGKKKKREIEPVYTSFPPNERNKNK